MKTRLVLRIYAVVLASLFLFALATGGLWRLLDHRDELRGGEDLAAQLVLNTLPSANAPPSEQQQSLLKTTDQLNVDVTLLNVEGGVIASVGERILSPRSGHNNVVQLALPDGRVVLARWQKPPFNDRTAFGWWFAGGLLVLLAIVALLSYPVVSRLTRRLELLRHTVADWGNGDLQKRAVVRGHDEVAQLSHSFNQAAERIESLLHAHKMLLANVSHELRTPLTRIRMNIEMLSQIATSEQLDKRKTDMTRDLNELNQMIEGVLVSSRLDAQERLDVVQPVDLLALSAQEAAYYDGVEVAGESIVVQGDASLLRRLLRNLLDNATKYGVPPTTVSVRKTLNGRIQWQVQDAGNGVLLDEPNDLFVPFARAHSGSTDGTGLGLDMVQKIAQLHGAQARIVSRRGEAMCVVIEFPAMNFSNE